nr:lytic polysaccharide monooxygenase [Bacillus swezeyi]
MKGFIKGAVLTAALGIGATLFTDDATAHGYIKEPASRGYMGSLEKQVIGWTAATQKYGSVVDNPQSVEGPKGFPFAGPADGKIASANGGSGQIDFGLDRQTADHWVKQDMSGGLNTFTWHYTAPHSTSKWHYYITKKDWDPNKPLTRDDFELIGTVEHDGSKADTNLTHEIYVPTDRSGYHVILGVWDVADTSNAFYNVIDVNLINDDVEDVEAPSIPTNLIASKVTDNTVELQWNASKDDIGIKEYKIYRNNEVISTTSNTAFTDKNLKADSTYVYSVEAIDFSGKASGRSDDIQVTTQKEQVEVAPAAPTGLHTMKITSDSVELMWSDSNDNVKEYEIYRDNQKITAISGTMYTDTGLKANTSYDYRVKAISLSGKTSPASEVLTVKTKENVTEPGEHRVFELGSLVSPVFYQAGEIIEHKGKLYRVVIGHSNYGDSTWSPDVDSTLWEPYY